MDGRNENKCNRMKLFPGSNRIFIIRLLKKAWENLCRESFKRLWI